MKIIPFILVFHLLPIVIFGQTSYIINETPLLDKYVNRCIDSLEPIEYLENHKLAKQAGFCSLAGCFFLLEMYDEDSVLNQAVFERVRQIAEKFYDEGTPIFISGGGMNSVEESRKLNEQGNLYGITYVSMGNSCLSFGSRNKGISEFNSVTSLLVNYPDFSVKSKQDKRKEKRRKRKDCTKKPNNR